MDQGPMKKRIQKIRINPNGQRLEIQMGRYDQKTIDQGIVSEGGLKNSAQTRLIRVCSSRASCPMPLLLNVGDKASAFGRLP